MDYTASQDLITNALSEFGLAVLGILGAVLVVAVAYLVFKFGWSKVSTVLFDLDDSRYKKRLTPYQRSIFEDAGGNPTNKADYM